MGKAGSWSEVQRGTTHVPFTLHTRPIYKTYPSLSLRSLVLSVSIAIYERSRRIFPRKPPLATCAKSLCESSRSVRCSTWIRCVCVSDPLFSFRCIFVSSDDGELGRRCGRILQWFWDHVEVKRAGCTDRRWTQAIKVTSLPFPSLLSAWMLQVLMTIHLKKTLLVAGIQRASRRS